MKSERTPRNEAAPKAVLTEVNHNTVILPDSASAIDLLSGDVSAAIAEYQRLVDFQRHKLYRLGKELAEARHEAMEFRQRLIKAGLEVK